MTILMLTWNITWGRPPVMKFVPSVERLRNGVLSKRRNSLTPPSAIAELHRNNPLIRQARSIEEPAGALNLCEDRCDCVRNGEARSESHTAFVILSYTDTTVSVSPAAKAFM